MSRKKWRSVMIVGLLAALTAALMSAATAPAAPNAGATVIVGSKNFTEEYVLGELYSQALKAKGFSVKYKQSIGATEVIDTALTSGKINVYPEYVGEIVQTVFHKTTNLPKTARGWWQLAVSLNKARGITVLNPTPFFDVDAIAVRAADAAKYHLKTVADLKKVPNASIGARPEFKDREEGFLGMKNVYGLTKMKYVSLDQGLTYQALDQKKVFSIDVFSTDPQLASGKYVVLKDPKLVFGVQNVAPEVSNKLLTALGSKAAKFKSTMNAVSAKLTQKAILAMNSAVVNNKQTPKAVASTFLKANGWAKKAGPGTRKRSDPLPQLRTRLHAPAPDPGAAARRDPLPGRARAPCRTARPSPLRAAAARAGRSPARRRRARSRRRARRARPSPRAGAHRAARA